MSAAGPDGDPWIAFTAERDEVIGTLGIAVLIVTLALLVGPVLLSLL